MCPYYVAKGNMSKCFTRAHNYIDLHSNVSIAGNQLYIIHNRLLEIDVTSALDRLTDPAYNLPAFGNVVSKTTTVVTRATTRLQIKPEEAPIPSDLLNEILVVRTCRPIQCTCHLPS